MTVTAITSDVFDRDPGEATAVDFHAAQIRARLLNPAQLDQLPPPIPLIRDFLYCNTLAALYGRPGCGKSFLALDFALSVVTGAWWMGREVHRGPVLYIAAEGAGGLGQRKRAWEQDRNLDVRDYPITWLPMAVNLLHAEWTDALVQIVVELNPVLVIVDTLARSMVGADENATRDMSKVIENADKVRVATGGAVLLVHHTPKSGETLRGSSALEGAVDTAIEVKADDETITVEVTKQKDAVAARKFALRLEPVAESAVIRSHGGLRPNGDQSRHEVALLTALMEATETDGLPTSTWLEIAGVAKASFYRARKSLLNRGLVRNVGTESKPRYVPTDDDEGNRSQ